jgi:hypothetical protein
MFFNHALDYLKNGSSLIFPQQYVGVSSIYLNFLNDKETVNKLILSHDELKSCFDLYHFIDHDSFFDFLTHDLFDHWSTHNVIIAQLNSNLQYDIYLHCPYILIPESHRGYYDMNSKQYKLNELFLNAWLQINKNRSILVDKKDIYYHMVINYLVNLHVYTGGLIIR